MSAESGDKPAPVRVVKTTRRRWIVGAVVVVLTVGAVWAVREVRHAFHEMFMAEDRLHAMYFVLGQVTEYVEDHREWPKSWDDLPQKLRGNPPGGWTEWSSNFPPLPELVTIDFNAKLEEIAKQTPETFTGVRFTPGAYYNHFYPIKEVIEAAQRAESSGEK